MSVQAPPPLKKYKTSPHEAPLERLLSKRPDQDLARLVADFLTLKELSQTLVSKSTSEYFALMLAERGGKISKEMKAKLMQAIQKWGEQISSFNLSGCAGWLDNYELEDLGLNQEDQATLLGLKSLSLRNCNLFDACQFLHPFKNLESLDLSFGSRGPSCLFLGQEIPWLDQEFFLWSTSSLSKRVARKLKHLNLLGRALSNEKIVKRDWRAALRTPRWKLQMHLLRNCKQLESLKLSIITLADTEVPFPANLSSLRSLEIRNDEGGLRDLKGLSSLTQLRRLSLSYLTQRIEENSFLPLGQLQELESLSIHFIRSDLNYSVSFLSRLSKLKSLELFLGPTGWSHFEGTLSDTKAFLKLSELESLSFLYVQNLPDFEDVLAKLPKLKTLKTFGCPKLKTFQKLRKDVLLEEK